LEEFVSQKLSLQEKKKKKETHP